MSNDKTSKQQNLKFQTVTRGWCSEKLLRLISQPQILEMTNESEKHNLIPRVSHLARR